MGDSTATLRLTLGSRLYLTDEWAKLTLQVMGSMFVQAYQYVVDHPGKLVWHKVAFEADRWPIRWPAALQGYAAGRAVPAVEILAVGPQPQNRTLRLRPGVLLHRDELWMRPFQGRTAGLLFVGFAPTTDQPIDSLACAPRP